MSIQKIIFIVKILYCNNLVMFLNHHCLNPLYLSHNIFNSFIITFIFQKLILKKKIKFQLV